MEFDVETLSPTYRLTIGIPGKSNAFEISRKLGLSEEIIDRAGEFLKQEDVEFEKLLSSIEADRKQAQEDREKAASMREEIKEAEDQIKRKLSELAEKKEKILAAARAEARDILAEARDVAEDTQKKLREIDKMDSMAERHARLLESKRRIKETGNKYRETIKVPENYKPVTVDQLAVGEKVKVMTLGQNGEILTLPDSKGDMQVQIGLIKANVNLKDLMLLREGKAKKVGKTGAPASKSGKAKYGNLYKSKAMNVSLSINVRGQNLDDAIMNVDKYLDDAYMAGLEEVTIIHGRGEGILRTGLQAMFKKHKHVDSFRKGAFNEGGDGVTVVRLK